MDLSREVVGGDDEDGEDLDEVAVPRREELQVALRHQQLAQVGDHAAEPPADLGCLLLFAVIEGDRLGILTEADEGVAEVGLPLELLRVLPHQRLPQLHRARGAQTRVGEDCIEEIRFDRVEDRRERDNVDGGGEECDEEVE